MMRSKHLLDLPNEILILILELLDGPSLGCCLQLSKRFNTITKSESIWAKLVSSLRLSSPDPYGSFQELYVALHDHLWLHGKVWHGDRRFTGCLFIARYNPVLGAIQIYNLLANNRSLDASIPTSDVQPIVQLWEKPIFSLTKETPPNSQFEVQPPSNSRRGSIACSLSRAVAIPPERQDPSMSLWPPMKIPSNERARNTSVYAFRGFGHQPKVASDAAKKLFRFRKWMVFEGSGPSVPPDRIMRNLVKENVETFAALDSTLYTPDEIHPFRGLWVGDYAAHGWEFILFHQPSPNRVEGIKITGDINVPRGEYTFIIENLDDIIRTAHDRDCSGAKIINGKGQVAASQFMDHKFIDIEVIIIGPDEVALHWRLAEDIDFISKLKRLDINEFIYSNKAIMFRTEDDQLV